MNGPMERIARHITGQDVSLPAMFKALTAVIIIRTVMEKVLSSGHLLLYDPADHYECLVGDLHMYFSWVCIFLSMSVPVAAFLRIRYREAMKVTLVGFCITVSVPLLDYAWSLGKGDEIHYFRSFDTFLYNYVNLFNPLSTVEGVTAGVRAEVLTLFFGSFFFSWLGFRRSFARSFLLALTLYTIVYFYGYLLPLHHLAGIDLTTMAAGSTTRIEGSQSLFFAYLGPFLLSLLGVLLVLTGQKKGSGRMIVALLYPSRLLFYLFLLCFGFLFAAQQTGAYPKILNLPDMLKAVCAAVSICLLFVHAKLDNDLNDDVIDSVSNPSRPIASGFIGKEDARGLSTVTMALSFVLAIPVERDFFYFWLFIWGFSYVYSVPPFRLKRFWPLGHIALSLIGTAVFMERRLHRQTRRFLRGPETQGDHPLHLHCFFLPVPSEGSERRAGGQGGRRFQPLRPCRLSQGSGPSFFGSFSCSGMLHSPPHRRQPLPHADGRRHLRRHCRCLCGQGTDNGPARQAAHPLFSVSSVCFGRMAGPPRDVTAGGA